MTTGKYWDRPWSLVDGCTPCSPGCDHCWSMAMGKRFHRWPEGVVLRQNRLKLPATVKKPTVFCIWNDLFHKDVSKLFALDAFRTMGGAFHHTYLILTKRPERMKAVIEVINKPLHNEGRAKIGPVWQHVWLGVTVCNQAEADEKIPLLLQTPAAHRWISIEPCLSSIDLTKWLNSDTLRKNSNEAYYERKRNGLFKSSGVGSVFCGRRGEGLETQEDDGEQIRGTLRPEKETYGDEGRKVSVAGPPKNTIYCEQKEICDLCSQGSMDVIQQSRNTGRIGTESQRREPEEQQARQLGINDQKPKFKARHRNNRETGLVGCQTCHGEVDRGTSFRNKALLGHEANESTDVGRTLQNVVSRNTEYLSKTYLETSRLDAVVLGGETGPGARPMHPDWVRTVRDQCHFAGVPFFFKGWGKHIPTSGDAVLGRELKTPLEVLLPDDRRLLDGQEHNDLPWRPTRP